MEENRTDTPAEQETPKFRGLYRHVKISVRALDWIIGICIAVILVVFALEMRDPGFTITFDSRGGTDVPAQNQMYGELLQEMENVDDACSTMMSCALKGRTMEDEIQALAGVTRRDLEDALKTMLSPARSAMVIIHPEEGEEE